jgi:hypothetical protein
MPVIPRSVTLPVVVGVWFITLLVTFYTCSMLPWFRDYYEYYLTRGADGFEYSPFGPAGLATIFHRSYLVGIPLCLAVLGYGVRLLRPAQLAAAHVAWYAAFSFCLAALWLVWVLLVERGFYELLFPA